MQKYFYIAIGGALGALARYWVGSAVAGRLGARLPYGTFIVNITACLAIGFSLELLSKHVGLDPAWQYLVVTGFIGAYSTFSTFEWETFANLQTGGLVVAGAYVVSSVVLGLVAVWCGILIAKVML